MDTYHLKPGGLLIRTYIDDDHKLAEEDLTVLAHSYLLESVCLDARFTLKDLFALIEKDRLLPLIFGRDWAGEYLAEVKKENTGIETAKDIQYLELYSSWEKDTRTGTIDGTGHLSFHGVGPILQEDYVEHDNIIARKGSRITYGVEFRKVQELLDLPLVYNPVYSVREGNHEDISVYMNELEKVRVEHPTLAQVIHGVLWELSFHGGPEDSDAVFSEMTDDIDAVLKDMQLEALDDK